MVVATIGVFAMIFDDEGRLLCVRMNYANGGWTTPGGRVEPGESPVDALRREVLEETGYTVNPKSLIGVYAKPFEDDVVLCFEACITSRSDWVPNEEITEVRWFSAAELPTDMSAVVKARIQDALAGKRGVFREFNGPRAAT